MEACLRTSVIICLLVVGSTRGDATQGACPSSILPSSYLSAVTCTTHHISSSLRSTAPCQPRDKVVMVPWPNNTSVDQLTPSHVTVRRCSGGCHGQASACVPTATATRKVPVLLGRCPLGGGRCEKECASLEVEDETECSCGCRQQASGCRADQQFEPDTCSCRCRDRAAMTACLEAGRSWAPASCSCVCPPSRVCPGRQILDPSSCACLPHEFQEGPAKGEEREERSEWTPLLKWEYPVILTLAALNVLLLLIIAVLAQRHRTLQRRLAKQPPGHPAGGLAKNIYSPLPRGPGPGQGGDGPAGGEIQLYTSDSDLSSEQQSSEGSEKVQGGTDTSYCSDSLRAGQGGTYRPSPQPCYSPGPINPLPHYSSLRANYGGGMYTAVPCCQAYSSFASLPPPPSAMLLTGDSASGTGSTRGRETPL